MRYPSTSNERYDAAPKPQVIFEYRYAIWIKGRRYRYETLTQARAAAQTIYAATGAVVGIEKL